MGWESFDVVTFELGPFLQGQTRIVKYKVLINCFFLVLEVCNVKASYRKSCARNPLPLVTFVSFIKQTFCLLSVSTSCSHKHLGPLPTGVYLCQP